VSSIDIRPFTDSDLKQITQILNPYIESTAITFDTEVYNVESRRPWASQFSETGRYRCFVAHQGNQILGYTNSSPLRPKRAYDTSIEATVYCSPEAKGKGIGSLLYNTLFKALSNEDIHRAHAVITLPNTSSVALHKKFGFYEVGQLNEAGRKFNQYHSVLWMEKRLND